MVPERAAHSSLLNWKALKVDSVIAWFAMGLLLVTVVLLIDRPPVNERTDFSVTYIGSRMVYLGLGQKLYDLAEQEKLKKQILANAEPLIFEHPPFEALLLAPLGALPYRIAFLAWGLVNVAAWLCLPFLLRPYAPAPRDDVAYLLLWLIFLPLGAALFEGQSSLLMLLVYSIAFVQLSKGCDLQAGVVFGLALLKFQFAIPFVIILLLQKRWSFIRGFFATATGLGVLSLLGVGWRGLMSYARLLLAVAGHPDNPSFGSAVGMATVSGFLNPLLGNIAGHLPLALMTAAISLALIIATARRWKTLGFARSQRTFELMFAAAVVVSICTSLHMFTPDLSPLLLAMLLVAKYFPSRERLSLRLIVGAALVLFWMPPIFIVLLAHHCFYLLFPVLLFFLLGIFGLAESASVRSRVVEQR